MKFNVLNLLFILCIIFLAACTPSNESGNLQVWMQPNGKLKVLSTVCMINDLVTYVGGDHIDAITLIRGELDPHSYQMVKGDDEKLSNAQIIFYNGLGLEHGPSLQRHLLRNPNAVPLGTLLQQRNPELIILYQGQIDPHIWMDISLWSKTVPIIVSTLSAKDPAHADEYHQNGEKLIKSMQETHFAVQEILKKIPDEKRYLVTSHDAFNYFARAYLATEEERLNGLWQERVAAPEGLAPDSQLSATDIQLILDHLLKYNIHILFPESNVSKDSIRKIISAGKENGLDLHMATTPLYGDAMGPTGSSGDTYLKMIQFNADTIASSILNEGK